ncbi:MAG: recombinase family protein [Petrimonas sp.]|nr:recombinase family protein [Petrimonas sp.]
MKNRKTPFGYRMHGGKMHIHAAEAETVRWIFEKYAAGASYNALTGALADRGVPYDEDRAWNKNMVARMLADERYTGANGYPPVIDKQIFQTATVRKPTTGKRPDIDSAISNVRKLAKCAMCGNPLIITANNVGWERWKCPSCKALTSKATTPRLVQSIGGLLSNLTASHDMVTTPEVSAPDCTKSFRLENELNRELDSTDYSEDAARTLALRLAAAQYAQLGAEDYETERLRRLFINAEPTDTLNADLLKKAVSAILVYPDGKVSLKLKNGQIIERSADR